jgi:hypothetical protein
MGHRNDDDIGLQAQHLLSVEAAPAAVLRCQRFGFARLRVGRSEQLILGTKRRGALVADQAAADDSDA